MFFSNPSFEIGRIFGVPVKLDVSLILLAAIYVFRTRSIIIGLSIVVALLVAILLHELGHAVVSKAFGCRVRDITLMFFGGCASVLNMPRTPWKEAAIALAGPAVGGVLWLVCPHLSALFGGLPFVAAIIYYIGFISGWLSLFNLIPAFPMDGGRVLRAILTKARGRIYATRLSCRIAYVIAAAMGLYGLANLDAFLILIAFFVWSSARTELAALRYCDGDDDDDTIIISPPPYGRGNDYTKIHRER